MNVKMLQVGPLGTNCYILEDEKTREAAVIDPGGDAPVIVRALEGASLRCILLTHGHYDHTGAAAALQANWPDAPIYLNSRDDSRDRPEMQELFPPLSGDVRSCDEGDVITVGGLELTVMATPGHSEGSVTFRCQDILFCGDTLFAGSCGRTDFPGGNIKKIMNSLRRLGQLDGDFQVLPGHMQPSTLERERKVNPYLRQALAVGR